jgi:hypothetical protein
MIIQGLFHRTATNPEPIFARFFESTRCKNLTVIPASTRHLQAGRRNLLDDTAPEHEAFARHKRCHRLDSDRPSLTQPPP